MTNATALEIKAVIEMFMEDASLTSLIEVYTEDEDTNTLKLSFSDTQKSNLPIVIKMLEASLKQDELYTLKFSSERKCTGSGVISSESNGMVTTIEDGEYDWRVEQKRLVQEVINSFPSDMKQGEVAKKLGIHYGQLSAIKNGHQKLSETTIKKIIRNTASPALAENLRIHLQKIRAKRLSIKPKEQKRALAELRRHLPRTTSIAMVTKLQTHTSYISGLINGKIALSENFAERIIDTYDLDVNNPDVATLLRESARLNRAG
ncbi:MAG: helix-turn-helix transcriptional regulator [Patescibacteria group bacterium]|nr:helix-turn-helix transcriptional regulator [Patescibacteria group bacterium]